MKKKEGEQNIWMDDLQDNCVLAEKNILFHKEFDITCIISLLSLSAPLGLDSLSLITLSLASCHSFIICNIHL